MDDDRTPPTPDVPVPGPEPGPNPGTVLVTGGTSGLGAAVVRAVIAGGGVPVVLDRRPARAEVAQVLVDLADPVAAAAAVDEAAARCGPLDAVVTCAGIDIPGGLVSVPWDTWERVVAVNLLGTASVVRAALPQLRHGTGRVVTVASTLGHRAVGDGTAYCASKFAVVGFTRALAAELRGRVVVTLLTPGGMDTAFFDDREERYRPADRRDLADPDAVAAAVLAVLRLPPGVEIKELVVTAPAEPSWP